MNHDRFDLHPLNTRWKLVLAITTILALWGWASNMDYADLRMAECADLSTASHIGYWDPQNDTCKMEQRKPKGPR